MKLLLDTNIIVDIISKRAGYEDSLRLVKHCELGNVDGFATATTITDLMYILRKNIEPNGVREAVRTLLAIVDVANVMKSDIVAAFLSDIKDFEDAVQSSCAARIKADYIVTHNVKDFEKSMVAAITPQAVLKLIDRR